MSKPAAKPVAAPVTAPQTTAKEAPATDKPHHGGTTFQAPKGGKVIALPGMCMADECKKKSEKANFCMEHFDWFKEGLITKEGRRPSDFEKKYFNYLKRHRKQAA